MGMYFKIFFKSSQLSIWKFENFFTIKTNTFVELGSRLQFESTLKTMPNWHSFTHPFTAVPSIYVVLTTVGINQCTVITPKHNKLRLMHAETSFNLPNDPPRWFFREWKRVFGKSDKILWPGTEASSPSLRTRTWRVCCLRSKLQTILLTIHLCRVLRKKVLR